MSPEVPLRIITDDGTVEVVSSPDDLMTHLDSVDSTDPRNRVWVRDAWDRTVKIRVRGGMVEVFELA
jgi:hypothetical protein